MRLRYLLPVLLSIATGAVSAERIEWEVIGKLPHSRSDFVQGLEIDRVEPRLGKTHFEPAVFQVSELVRAGVDRDCAGDVHLPGSEDLDRFVSGMQYERLSVA